MKKQNKPACPAGRKLVLTKRTITNLESTEMQKHVGGATRHTCDGAATCLICDNRFTRNRHCWSF